MGGRLREGMPVGVRGSPLLPALLPDPQAGEEPPLTQDQRLQVFEKRYCLRGKSWTNKPSRQPHRLDEPSVPDCAKPVEHVEHGGGAQLLLGQQQLLEEELGQLLEKEQGWEHGCLRSGE